MIQNTIHLNNNKCLVNVQCLLIYQSTDFDDLGILTSIETTATYTTKYFYFIFLDFYCRYLSKVRTFSQNIDSANLITGDLLSI